MVFHRHRHSHNPPPPPPPSGGGLAPPVGYSASDLIFQDQFTEASLNTADWNPYMALNGIRWQGANDVLPYPYSAIGNLPGGNNAEYGDPYPYGYGTNNGAGAHMVGGNGSLELIASPDAHEANYTWASAYVSGTGKLAVLPATGGYVQISAKMPDSTHGGWGSLWFMPENGTGNEMDLQETGFLPSGIPVNQVMASSIHSGPERFSNVGVDTSAAYHTYGIEYIPGKSVKTYFDGALEQSWTTGVSTGAYELIMSMTMMNSNGPNLSPPHTVADPVGHPGPYAMSVNDVQIYRYPP